MDKLGVEKRVYRASTPQSFVNTPHGTFPVQPACEALLGTKQVMKRYSVYQA